eukprot:gene15572-18461_t
MADTEQPPVEEAAPEVPAEEAVEAEPAAEEAAPEAEPEAAEPADAGVLGKRKPDDDEQPAAGEEEEPPAKRATVEGVEGAEVPAEAAPETDAAAVPAADTVTEMVECPLNMIGRLIGKNGETIKALEAVAAGVAAVNECLQAPPEALASSPEASESIDCPPGLVGRIIGRGGETIKGLQQASGATISIDQNFPENVPRKVHISGSAHQVAQGKKLVMELLQGGPAAAAHLLGASQGPGFSLDCPKDMVGRVIGRGGETIKGLQHHSGARIQIDQHSNPCKAVGLADMVHPAVDMEVGDTEGTVDTADMEEVGDMDLLRVTEGMDLQVVTVVMRLQLQPPSRVIKRDMVDMGKIRFALKLLFEACLLFNSDTTA